MAIGVALPAMPPGGKTIVGWIIAVVAVILFVINLSTVYPRGLGAPAVIAPPSDDDEAPVDGESADGTIIAGLAGIDDLDEILDGDLEDELEDGLEDMPEHGEL